MNKFFYYCPYCGLEKTIDKKEIPRNRAANCRDGYGVFIYHFECERCGNLDAGAMWERDGDKNEKEYYKHVISMYQNIRGFNDGRKEQYDNADTQTAATKTKKDSN